MRQDTLDRVRAALANFYVGEDGMGGIYLECDSCGRTVHREDGGEYPLVTILYDANEHDCRPGERLYL